MVNVIIEGAIVSKHYPPEYQAKQFNCIYCGVFAKQEWYTLNFGHNNYGLTVSPITSCECQHCFKLSYWCDSRMLIPAEAPCAPPHPDMPKSIIGEYQEARSIFVQSPRAAVALLRLAIQKLMPEFGEKGENINDDIKSLVAKGLPIKVQQALDFCRVVGNNAVHPGKINLNDTPEMGQHLFECINFIVEELITRPNRMDNFYAKLPEAARAAIEKRDA